MIRIDPLETSLTFRTECKVTDSIEAKDKETKE